MRTILLACNVPAETCGRLRFVCMRMNALLRIVPREAFGRTLREAVERDPQPLGEPSFDEGLLVMCGFASGQMDQLLREAKTVPLKAVLTQTNRRWTFNQLYAELAKERAALSQG